MTTNITSFTYASIREAIQNGGPEVEKMRLAFASRAKVIFDLVSKIPGVKCPRPTGAFYVFPDVSAYFGKTSPAGKPINSAMDMCEALLAEKHVAFVPGEDFGGCGKNCVRISFACSEDQIRRGVERFSEFLAALK
jgi:aspartate aminotransferase